eukprot:TRINITY_DN64362_c0_g2_i1.p1 TRINITY_DN64362_c0_g2~~TRINITY_DN64362_c0_g2_i1.p1  ORF type:complete len:545 (+),score=52.93 TRINITY_DN64362_c0_g2_i1:84-1718(+)
MGCGASTIAGVEKDKSHYRIIVKHLADDELFVDEDFPAVDSSIFVTPSSEFPVNTKWRRAGQIFPPPQNCTLFHTPRGNGRQGKIGNCWFISALNIIATRRDILHKLVVANSPEHGLYEFRFFKEGKWKTVVVDDFLPVKDDGTLLFASSSSPGELWVPLIEKAYAKLHGSYQALQGGCNSYAMVDMTGGASEFVSFNTQVGANLVKKGFVLQKIRQAKAEGWLMGCSFKAQTNTKSNSGQSHNNQHQQQNGLIPEHAYSLLDIRSINTIANGPDGKTWLVKINNPWGKGEWTGDWSPTDQRWTPQLRAEVGSNVQEANGTFWMSFNDWQTHAAALSICRTYRNCIGKPYYVITEPLGNWKMEGAAGSSSHKNPQYLVMAEQRTCAFIYIMQDDKRYTKQQTGNNHSYDGQAIGLCLAKADEGKRLGSELFNEAYFVFGTPFSQARAIGADIKLEEGECYSVMPCQKNSGIESDFRLYVFSTGPVRMKKTTEKRPCEDEYTSVVLKTDNQMASGLDWDPQFRFKIFNGHADLPANMETVCYDTR